MNSAGPANETFQIPNIAPNASRLLLKLMAPDLDLKALRAELQQVPSIVARLIALANSPWSKPASPITDFDNACGRLGLQLVRTMSLGLIVGKSLDDSRCAHFDSVRYWSSSMICADTAALLAAHFDVTSSTARTVGLLHNIGLLLLADRLPDQLDLALQSDVDASLDERVEAECGFGYWDAGARVLEHWGLPSLIVSGLQDRALVDNPEELAVNDLVRLSARLANAVCRQDAPDEFSSPFVDSLTLETIFAQQIADYEANLELTKALFN